MTNTNHIHAGWMIDGTGDPTQKNILLTIEDGYIADISKFEVANAPDQSTVTDLSFATILPPFIDCHVHLALSSTVDQQAREKQLHFNFQTCGATIRQNLHYLLSHGVMAVRDGGDNRGHVLRYKNEISQYTAESPPVLLQSSGCAWHNRGRYGSALGRCPENGETLADSFKKATESPDHIKIIHSGVNSLHVLGIQTPPQFDLSELQELKTLAELMDKKIMVHANGELPVRQALEAGCHSIEHGYFMGRDNLEIMAQKNITWVPTLFAMKSCIEQASSQKARLIARKTLDHQIEQVALARQLGVTVALGTDAGSPGVIFGESVIEEMKLLKKADYSFPEVIKCATFNGAQLLGLDEIGILTQGKPATFLVARGTPSQLPRKLSYLEGMYERGLPSSYYRKNPVKVL